MDETSMIERVARAIAKAALDEGDGMFDAYALTEEVYDGYLSQARAAIEAMREPTEEMLDATGGECRKWAPGAWQKDFDFVTIDNYCADMDDLGQTAARAVELLKRKNDQQRLLIAALVKAAGGRIEVYQGDLQRIHELELIEEYSERDMTHTFRTRPLL